MTPPTLRFMLSNELQYADAIYSGLYIKGKMNIRS